jgi:NTP pyrophosphatase (non-canonical NTP hydrolase)
MTFQEYQRLARRTQNEGLDSHDRMYHALHGLSSEIGEIHGLYQKVYQGHADLHDDDLADELGDLLWFAAELADAWGLSLDHIARRNIDKLKARYPDGFDSERSIHRPEYTEVDE